MRASFYLLVLAVGLAGCELVVDVDLPAQEPQIAVNGFVEAGRPWYVTLGLSRGVLDDPSTRYPRLDNAVVEVFYEGRLLTTLEPGTFRTDQPGEDALWYERRLAGQYYAQTPLPRAGETYTLRVRANGYPTVEATTTLPPAVVFDTVQVASVPDPSVIPSYREVRARIRITDTPQEPTFFFLVTQQDGRSFGLPFALTGAPFAPVTSFLFDDLKGGLPFTDATFTDGATEAVVRFAPEGRSRDLVLYSVSEAYYQYHATLKSYREAEENPFAEPAPVFSNVEGGQGIFAGLTAARRITIPVAPLRATDVASTYAMIDARFTPANAPDLKLFPNPSDFTLTLHPDGTISGFMRLAPDLLPDLPGGYEGSLTGTHQAQQLDGTNRLQLDLDGFDALDGFYGFTFCGPGCRSLYHRKDDPDKGRVSLYLQSGDPP